MLLILNTGSSSLKFALYTSDHEFVRIADGYVYGFGEHAELSCTIGDKPHTEERVIETHVDALKAVVEYLKKATEHSDTQIAIDAVGMRVVHGLHLYTQPTRLTDDVIAQLESFSDMSPLHHPFELRTIQAVREIFGSEIPIVGVFDTAFHTTLPEKASRYALPSDITETYHLRRYGFHGLAHEAMLRQYAAIVGKSVSDVSIITLQLGSGSSVCAINHGVSVDTSMGFTPMEGLMMRTRSGDIDPGILTYLARQGIGAEKMEDILNRQSGLAGISGTDGHMKTLLEKRSEDEKAKLAIDMFCYRIRKYIGAYTAVLGSPQAVVIGGGMGENSPDLREMIFEGQIGNVHLDKERNYATLKEDRKISTDDSPCGAYVIAVDESVLIAQYASQQLKL